ncbi:hypothetical protein PF008_g25624 [Phytophthora fragariae]|uniref:Intimal thickness related receptor IRP domain-containing protein n=1 Tax=Phytophthora fragariae TaxID=53985 RepID=A0A6G0QK14_9STRA|nr:hypothetical protein PF008_g25624 [Phytophthora fragariae]
MTITQDDMDSLARTLFIPVMLVLDSAMFQYLVMAYYSRRQEPRVRLLLLASFLGFATQVYSHESKEMALELNDISETSLQLTFLTQISLIGRAVCSKVKVRCIYWFTCVAEVLVGLCWLDVVCTILEVANVIEGTVFHLGGNVLESISLLFVLVFRFCYLSLMNGFRNVLVERKLDISLYVLLALHEYPFMILEHKTGVSWEFAQGIFNRIMIVACIVQNLRQKALPSSGSSYSAKSRKYSISSIPIRLKAQSLMLKSAIASKSGSFRSYQAPRESSKIVVSSSKWVESFGPSANTINHAGIVEIFE